MSRYIDADAIISFVNAGHLNNPMEKTWSDNDVVDMIESRPTVDAVPVVHGEWVEKWRFKPNGNPYHKVGDMECSVCHSDMLGRYYSRYCPHCGARMDGERKDGADDGRTD